MRLYINKDTTVTFRLFPNTLYCCLNVTLFGKDKLAGNPSNLDISLGVKYLNFSGFKQSTSLLTAKSL